MGSAVNDRQEAIRAYMVQHNMSASVHHLSKVLYSSEATIRRDLVTMEQQGIVKRIYGGAILNENRIYEIPYLLRDKNQAEAKEIIARKAATLVHNGDVIFMSASSTIYRLVPYLRNFQNLTIVTNGPHISMALNELQIENYCTGGLIRSKASTFVGRHACDFFAQFNPSLVFFSSRAVNHAGYICGPSSELTEVQQALIGNGGRRVFLCDSSKFGQEFPHNTVHLSKIDTVISEKEIPAEYRKYCREIL